MRKRATKHEHNTRIHRVAALLAKGSTNHQLLQFTSEQFGISERQGREVIRKARELIAEDYNIERPDFVASRLFTLDVSLQAAMKEKRFGCVVQIVRLQSELVGVLGRGANWQP